MTDKEKIAKLKTAFDDIVWMAIRYADGRQTFAPSTVRDAIASFQEFFPEWKPKADDLGFESDYLYDLVRGV